MIRYKIVQITLILFISSSIAAQNQYDINHQKYWYYRFRLQNDFLGGEKELFNGGLGRNIPANERAYLGQWGLWDNNNILQWGDATMTLGWYIGVLATEYRLLKDSNQDVSDVAKELTFALVAFDRLDAEAEISWGGLPSQWNGVRNGFFIRDDVHSFMLDFPGPIFDHFNSGLTSRWTVREVNSSFYHNPMPPLFGNPNEPPTEETHDQVWDMLMGLSLVTKFVDPRQEAVGTDFSNTTNATNTIREEAADIVDRMIGYIKSNIWTIRNPVLDNCVRGICDESERPNGDCLIDTKCGSNAQWLAFGAAEAACFASGRGRLCSEFHNVISIANEPIWQEYQDGVGLAITLSIEDYKVQLLAALGSSWFRSVGNPPLPVNTTSAALGVRSLLQSFEIFPLLHQALHGGLNFVPKSFYENLMTDAPCEGPYNFGFPEHSTSEQWSSNQRWTHPERRGEKNDGTDKNEFKGEYNGLDYMLLHNLYYIIFPEEYNAVNFINRKVELNYPRKVGFTQIGSHTLPLVIEAFNTIEANNVISEDGDVTYRAGVEITLKPGFEVKRGADFHAFIAPLQCDGNGGYQKTSGAGNSPYQLSYNLPTAYKYYDPRIKGTKQITDYTGLQSASCSVDISPNPNNGLFRILLDFSDYWKIEVFNMLGESVKHTTEIQKHSAMIDISNNPMGIYFVRIISTDGNVKIGKIIFQ